MCHISPCEHNRLGIDGAMGDVLDLRYPAQRHPILVVGYPKHHEGVEVLQEVTHIDDTQGVQDQADDPVGGLVARHTEGERECTTGCPQPVERKCVRNADLKSHRAFILLLSASSRHPNASPRAVRRPSSFPLFTMNSGKLKQTSHPKERP